MWRKNFMEKDLFNNDRDMLIESKTNYYYEW